MKPGRMLFAALAALLPGDHIHAVAPVSRFAQSNSTKVEQLAAAEAKRGRKAAKRLADATRTRSEAP